MQYRSTFRNLSNDQLLSELRASHQGELHQQARVLRLLEEVDRRRLYAELGFPSLYQFCVSVLRMSEHEAYLRMTVARTGQRFPMIFGMIERGDLHLTAVGKLATHLTAENHRSLLDAAVHKTKREVEELIAARFPQPDVASSIRPLKAPAPTPKSVVSAPVARSPASPPANVESRRDTVQPLAPERYAIRFTASARCRELLERAKALMSHRAPNADVGDVVEEALVVLVAELEKKKFRKTDGSKKKEVEPKSSVAAKSGRYIPAHVKRQVHERDGGRCSYVGPEGHRCNARAFLEFDHAIPIAHGGESTVENVRLRCRVHNDLAARREFGDQQMILCSSGFHPVLKTSSILGGSA